MSIFLLLFEDIFFKDRGGGGGLETWIDINCLCSGSSPADLVKHGRTCTLD